MCFRENSLHAETTKGGTSKLETSNKAGTSDPHKTYSESRLICFQTQTPPDPWKTYRFGKKKVSYWDKPPPPTHTPSIYMRGPRPIEFWPTNRTEIYYHLLLTLAFSIPCYLANLPVMFVGALCDLDDPSLLGQPRCAPTWRVFPRYVHGFLRRRARDNSALLTYCSASPTWSSLHPMLGHVQFWVC